MRVGAIDIGTNTVLLLVAEQRDGQLVPVLERATITRLGENVDRSRRLLPEAVERTLACLKSYAGELSELRVSRLRAVGTSALRDAAGGTAFLDEAERLLGVRPEVISGAEEARLTFSGALSGLGLVGPVTVFDVGGGSTEVIVGLAGAEPRFDAAKSLDVGSVRLFERHVRRDPPSSDELLRVAEDVDRALADAPAPLVNATLLGVAGTVTTLAAVALGMTNYDASRIHGHVLTRDQVFEVAAKLGRLDLEARRKLAGLEPKRADVIVVGAEIVRRVVLWCGGSEILVSDRGVRWGLAEQLITAPH